MNTQRLVIPFLLLITASAFAQDTSAIRKADTARTAVVIPVEGEVGAGLFYYLQRAVEEAQEVKPDVCIFEINTYGGELHSTFEISDLMTSIEGCSTYAYVHQKAISAGALIAMSAQRLAMGRGTTIGDVAPIVQGQEGPVVLGEKIQSPLRAKFRSLAERHGYPALLAESMVTMELGVVAAYPPDTTQDPAYLTVEQWEALSKEEKARYRDHQVIVPKGQLLTMTDREAERYGFSVGSFESLEEFARQRDLRIVQTIDPNWSESLVRLIGRFAPLLMLVGFGMLYVEFKSPGFGLFGIAGIALLLLVFGSKYLVGLADHTELLLLLLGAGLFFAEIYVFPGTLILGGLGILLMIASMVLSFQNFTLPDPELPWQMDRMLRNLLLVVSAAVGALLFPFAAAKWLLPHLPRRMSLIEEATLAGARANEPLAELSPGQQGTTRTALRPWGKVRFAGKTYEAVAASGHIESGKVVEILSLQGTRINVREVAE